MKLTQIGDVLQYAHDRNIVHCDLKPENILFGQNDQLQFADFGIAVILSSAQSKHGIFVGTMKYMSPEHFDKEVRKESDQYSLACIAYELFTGRHPFQAQNFSQWFYQHTHKIPAAPESVNSAVPVSVGDVILKGLAKEYHHRYKSVSEFIHELKHAYEHPHTARRAIQPLPRSTHRLVSRPRIYDLVDRDALVQDAPRYRVLEWNDDDWDVFAVKESSEKQKPPRRERDDHAPLRRRELVLRPFQSQRSSRSQQREEARAIEAFHHRFSLQPKQHRGFSRREENDPRALTQRPNRPRNVPSPRVHTRRKEYSFFAHSAWWPVLLFGFFLLGYTGLSSIQHGWANMVLCGVIVVYVGYTWFFFLRELYDAKGFWAYCAIALSMVVVLSGSASVLTQDARSFLLSCCLCMLVSVFFRFLQAR